MEEVYTGEGLLETLRHYILEEKDGLLDGYEVAFPQGLNTLDPLFLIQRASTDASFEKQVELTKAMILNKPVKFVFWGEPIGEMQLNSPETSFAAFPVFEEHPVALQFLIRTCYIQSLKNLLPPLNASQSAARAAALARRQSAQVKS